jgi:hypothetical protein
MDLVVALGGSDCERIGTWVLRQPVNAVSSLAYVVAAAAVARRAIDSDGRRLLVAYAGSLAGVGAGSVAYHGPQPGWAGPVHDVTIAVAVGLAIAVAGTRLRRGRQESSGADALLLVVVVAAAVLAYAAGRTGSPVCRPASRLQPHAAWHVISAATAVLLAPSASRRPAG